MTVLPVTHPAPDMYLTHRYPEPWVFDSPVQALRAAGAPTTRAAEQRFAFLRAEGRLGEPDETVRVDDSTRMERWGSYGVLVSTEDDTVVAAHSYTTLAAAEASVAAARRGQGEAPTL